MIKTNTLLIMATLVVSACGGGGGGAAPSPEPTVDIDSSNSQEASAKAANGGIALSAVGIVTPSGAGTPAASPKIDFANTFSKQIFNGVNKTTDSIQSAPIFTCDSGSVTEPAIGATSGTITFSNCSLEGFVINGSISFSATVSGSDFTATITYSNVTFSSGGTILATFNGDQGIASNSAADSITISGNSFSVTFGADYVKLINYSFTYAENFAEGTEIVSFDYTIDSSLLGGVLRATTATAEGGSPFINAFGDPYPHTGSVVVIGANNTRAKASATGDGSAGGLVTIETDATDGSGAPGGDGVYESMNTVTWATFDLDGTISIL